MRRAITGRVSFVGFPRMPIGRSWSFHVSSARIRRIVQDKKRFLVLANLTIYEKMADILTINIDTIDAIAETIVYIILRCVSSVSDRN